MLVGPFHFYHRVKNRLEELPFYSLSILLILKDKSVFFLRRVEPFIDLRKVELCLLKIAREQT